MQAQRKIDPAVLRGFVQPTVDDTEGWAPRPTEGGTTSPSSPAHLLLLELSARLHQPAPAAATIALPVSDKWPMPARLAAIATLSAACWGAIYVAALSLV